MKPPAKRAQLNSSSALLINEANVSFSQNCLSDAGEVIQNLKGTLNSFRKAVEVNDA